MVEVSRVLIIPVLICMFEAQAQASRAHNAGERGLVQQLLPVLPASVAVRTSSALYDHERQVAQQRVTGKPTKGWGRSMFRGPPLNYRWRRLLLDCNANQDLATQIASGCFSLGSTGSSSSSGASGTGQSPAPPAPGTGIPAFGNYGPPGTQATLNFQTTPPPPGTPPTPVPSSGLGSSPSSSASNPLSAFSNVPPL